MSAMKVFFKTPFTLWLIWLAEKLHLEFKYRKSKLNIDYLARAKNCSFGVHNRISARVLLVNVSIGNFSYIAADSKLINTRIGKFTSIGDEVIAGLGMHPSREFVSTHPLFYTTSTAYDIQALAQCSFEEYSPITIGNDVWIGARSIILDGVSIGNGAIIGAGSVVSKDVPPYSIVGGVPAKLIRMRFEKDEIDFLEQLCWWDKDLDWLENNASKFGSISILMKSGQLQH
jgi:acetyltransferase-like isoleucine patch superfamily enzyme